jgi:AcrR family transcriptional regulator
MPRPPLTRTRIVAAGVSVAHELGLPAVDLRSVARRVNTTATGLRRHIGTTELVDAVVAEIVSHMPAVPSRGDHLRRLRTWTSETRDWLTEYPGLAPYLLANRWDVPGALDRLEDLARVLQEVELAPGEAAPAAISVFWFVLSGADLHTSPRIIGLIDEAPVLAQPGDEVRWPLLDATVGDYSQATTATQFDFGLELLLEAIGARARPEPVTPPRPAAGRPRSSRPGARVG